MTQVIVNGLYLGAQYALIALGLTLIFALMNVLNFAHGQMYVFGGFITYTVYGQLHLPFVVALACSGVTLAIIGALFERLLFRTVIRRSMRDESTMLLAAGIGIFPRCSDPAAVRRKAARRAEDRQRRTQCRLA